VARILFVLSGIDFSGAEIVLLDTLPYLNGHDFSFFLMKRNERLIEEITLRFPESNIFLSSARIPFNRITRMALMSVAVFMYTKKITTEEAWDKVKKAQIDLVYLNNTVEALFFPFELLPYPTIAHVHDMVDSLKPAFRMELLSKLRKVEHIVTVSHASRKALKSFGIDENKVTVIYNSIPKLHSESSLALSDFGSKQNLNIGYVGSIIKRKGVDILIKACCLLSRKINKRITVHMVYHSYDEGFLKKILRIARCSDKLELKLLGTLRRDEVLEFYKEVDLVVVPSRRDPLPTTVIEALATGKLVIGANVDGIPEMLGDEFFLFKPGDHKDLSEKIFNVLGTPLDTLNHKFILTLQKIKKDFSPEIKADKINSVIKAVSKIGYKRIY